MSTSGTWWELAYRGGLAAWENTYKLRPNDDDYAVMATAQWAGQSGLVAAPEVGVGRVVHRDSRLLTVTAQARWVDGGCRTIRTDAKYFAAMAHTKIAKDATEALRIPWPSFAVQWPRGLCVSDDGRDYTSAIFTQFSDVTWIAPPHESPRQQKPGEPGDDTPQKRLVSHFAITTDSTEPATAMQLTSFDLDMSLGTLLFDSDHLKTLLNDERDMEQTAGDMAIKRMVTRAVAGLLYTMQHTNHWRATAFTSVHGTKPLRDSPPPHRTIFVGRPIAFDATQSVRDRAAARVASAPSVQTLVIGHVKRQVCGPGRGGRKVIWVEPYWRGPEDAPILARPYRVGSE